ncbi:MAG: thioredoxin domain-containing protein [Patescibacteria group bacterium]
MESTQAKSFLTVPVAILIAGALVAGSVIWTNVGKVGSQVAAVADAEKNIASLMKPVSSDEHILGNPNASIKIVEYSDASCPFCKIFHATMNKIIDTYGASGDVAWVYRHFPIDKEDATGRVLHPNAGHEAQAMECAASLGGNQKFWAYTNRLYDVTPSVTPQSPNGLDQKELPKIAEFVGLNVADFNSCLSSGKFKDKVESQYLEALNIGLTGTPSSVLITPDGKYIPIEGALPFESIKQAIDALIAEANK